MTYTPGKVIGKNIETEEQELKPQLVQINLDLISAETKRLDEKINSLNSKLSKNKKRISELNYSKVLLLG